MNIDHKDSRDAEVQSYFTMMKKSPSFQLRVQIANILAKMYEKNYEYSDGIFTRIYRFISDSNDRQERKIGLIVLARLALKMQGSARSAFVNKFHSPVFKLFESNQDENLIELIQDAYSVILQIGGNQNDSVVQSDLSNSLLLLKNNSKDVRKICSYSAIRVLINTSPYLTFKKLLQKYYEDGRDNLSVLISSARSKNIKVRESYLRFLSDYIQYAAEKKDSSYQEHTMNRFLNLNLIKDNQSQQVIHLNIETLRIFLNYMKQTFSTEKFQQSVKFINEKISSNKSPVIQQSLIKIIPFIIDRDSPQGMLSSTLEYLMSISGKDEVLAQRAINEIIYNYRDSLSNLSQKILKPLLKDVMETLKSLASKPLTKISEKSKTEGDQIILFEEEYLIEEKVEALLIILLTPIDQTQKRNKSFTNVRKTQDHNSKCIAENLLTSQQLNSLASFCLLLSLTKKTLKLINEISRRNLHNLGVTLQSKLILLISKILTGTAKKALNPKQMTQEMKQFLDKLDKIMISESDENKVRAIEALSLFKFRDGVKDFIGGFVKQKVLKNYLQRGNGLMRCASVEAAFNLYTKKNNAIAENQMMEILDRLIRVGMTDNEQFVRQKVFSQLYSNIQKIQNFHRFIVNSQILIHLIQGTKDPNETIRLTCLKCITSLYKKQPSPTIIPYLKEFLFIILNHLQTDFKYNPQKNYLIKALSLFIQQSPSIIENHVEVLLESILGYLEDRKNYQGLQVLFFHTFDVIIQHHPHKALLYIVQICQQVVHALGDKLGTKKRSQSLKLLNTLVKNCGYVVIPYFEVPELLDSLIYLLKSEISSQTRIDVMRIIGGFGAIDKQKFHKIKSILNQYNKTQNYEIISQNGFQFKFLQWRQELEKQKKLNSHQIELKQYYNEMLILQANSNRKNSQTTKNNQVAHHLISKILNNQQQSQVYNGKRSMKQYKLKISNKDFETAQKRMPFDKIGINTDNFNLFIINCLISIVNDTFLKQKAQLALDVLLQIFEILGKQLQKDLAIIIQLILSSGVQCLDLIIILARDCDISDYLDDIIQHALNHNYSTQLLTDFLEIVSYKYKPQLQFNISSIISRLYLLTQSEKLSNNIPLQVKIIIIYHNLRQFLQPHLSQLIPQILDRYFGGSKNNQITKTCIELFLSLTTSCRSMVQYLSQIIGKFVGILKLCSNNSGCNHVQCRPCLRNKIGNCFVLFLITYQHQFMVYLPTIHQAMIVQKHQLYEKALHYMQNCYYGNLRDQFSQEELEKIIPDVRTPLLNRYQIPKFVKKIEGTQQLIQQFDVINKKFIEEDWIQWLRKISVLMIKKSPNVILRTCSDLAQGYTQLSLELFNISFFCLWEILLDGQKKELINHLIDILTLHRQPAQILVRKTLLNLCEFMNRKKTPLQISHKILSKCAEQSSAYSKTLYYKQMQLSANSDRQTFESLIEIYMKLGQPENAHGLLKVAQNNGISCEVQWYEKLSMYEEAFEIYHNKLLQFEEQQKYSSKSQLLTESPQYQQIVVKRLKCLKYLNQERFLDELQDDQRLIGNPELAVIASKCYIDLEQWDKVQQWTNAIPENFEEEKTFNSALIEITKSNLDSAAEYIYKNRKIIYNQVSELIAFSSSTTSFEKIIKAQKLCQLDEIIELKKLQSILDMYHSNNSSSSSFSSRFDQLDHDIMLSHSNRNQETDKNYPIFIESQSHIINLQNEYKKKVQRLKNMWGDRLQGCPKQEKIWGKLSSIRSLFFKKLDYFQFFYQYCEICIASNKIHKCEKLLHQFKHQILEIREKNEAYDFVALMKKQNLISLLEIQISFSQNMVTQEAHVLKIVDFLRKNKIDSIKKSQIYYKCANKMEEIYKNDNSKNKVIQLLEQSTSVYTSQYQLQILAKLYLQNLNSFPEKRIFNIKMALNAYIKILKTSQTDNQHFLQSCLRVLSVLLKYSDESDQIYNQFLKIQEGVPIQVWINVIPQMIAHLHQANQGNFQRKSNFTKIIKDLLLKTGLKYPQTVLYCLNFAIRTKIPERIAPAQQILSKIKQNHTQLCEQIQMISKQLSKAAIKAKQYWYDTIQSAWGIYSQNKNSQEVINLLLNLKEQIYNRQSTNSQRAFHQQFGQYIKQGYHWLERYENSNPKNMIYLSQAFELFIQVYQKIKDSFESLNKIYLNNVAPNLVASRNYCSTIPGLYSPKSKCIKISSFQNQLTVLKSKQKPRKLKIYGDDGKQYNFLLKGRQDIRLDERVMQFFGLVNKLLEKQRQSLKQNLKIERYSIIPLTVNTGLIGWVENCDTLNQLIREYRTSNQIRMFVQREVYEKVTPHYAYLPVMNKLEIFLNVQESTQGKDIQNVFYYNSQSSQEWVERRHVYTTSLATMSMVGYILGLGDRHPSNIMVNKKTGKIVHIDFGDCFQVAVLRQKFPEKIPFRLTRMLRNAMGAVGIHGLYKHTCQNVMRVLRDNKQSLESVLETFAHDPILSWRIIIEKKNKQNNQVEAPSRIQKQKSEDNARINFQKPEIPNSQNKTQTMMGSIMQGLGEVIQTKNGQIKEEENFINPGINKKYQQSIYPERINKKAIDALIRIKKKLSGTDWRQEKDDSLGKNSSDAKMSVEEQVQKLIYEAMSPVNICQSWPGWCPYW